jgi:hypothetical protein
MKKTISWLFMLFCTLNMYAQENREQQLEKIKLELSQYLQYHLPLETDPAIEKKIQEIQSRKEEGKTYTAEETKEQYATLKAFFIENQFWNKNPAYQQLAAKRHIGSSTNLCANGGFENGNTAFTHSQGILLTSGSNNCAYANDIPFNPTLPTSSVGLVPNRMELVTNGPDPIVGSLQRTHSGSKALRINAPLDSAGRSCRGYQKETDLASTSFTVAPGSTSLTFWYAVILQQPNHYPLNGLNPFFTARLRDETTGTVQTICLDASQRNLPVATDPCASTYFVAYQSWRCGSFNLKGMEGRTVTLEFIAADCALGQHFGYAYIDDICTNCPPTGTNDVTIQSPDACFTDGYDFSGTYRLQSVAGYAFQSLSVSLWNNGRPVSPPIPFRYGANLTYSGTVPFNFFRPGVAYDLVVTGIFNTASGQQVIMNEIIPGINNDFTANAAACCNNPTPPATAFTIQTTNNNGVLVVTATSNVPAPANHWWGLMETRLPGNVYDSVTVGQNQVQSAAGLSSVRFTIADSCNAYYIKHGIWLDGCYFWREERIPLATTGSPTNNFNFQEQYNEPRTTFCFGEDIYLNAAASTGENAYLIEISRQPVGGTGIFTPFGRIGWDSGNLNIPINLSQIFATQTPALYFEPGFDYRVKLTLAKGTKCAIISERTETFNIKCCNDFLDAKFTPVTKPTADGYRIDATSFNRYVGRYTNAQHTWRLASSSRRGGPYRPIVQSSQPNFSYTFARNGLYYFLVHEVVTLCGNFCYAQEISAQNGIGAINIGDCRLLNTIWGICNTPTNPKNNCRQNILSWDAVAYAASYQVEVTTNAAGCCRNGSGAPVTTNYQTTTNSLPVSTIPNGTNSCFSWRVLTVCANGQSNWSVPQCYNCNPTILTPATNVKPVKVTGGK